MLNPIPTTMNSASLNWATPNGDDIIAYVARMSSKINQARMLEIDEKLRSLPMRTSTAVEGGLLQQELDDLTTSLIQMCVREGHVSVLEQVCMSVFVRTTRAMAPQFFRHNSFRFQEFSQRYAVVQGGIPTPQVRFINESGRKRDKSVQDDYRGHSDVTSGLLNAERLYQTLLSEGVHPESARMVLPLCTPTTFAMTGNIRDWTFYLKNRLSPHAQEEHRMVARDILRLYQQNFPIVHQALGELIQGGDQ